MVSKVTCPECETVLKLAKPVSPGRSIKCPECRATFAVPDDDEPAPRPRPKAAAPARKGTDKKAPAKQGVVKKAGKEKTADKVTKKPGKEEKVPAPAAKKKHSDDDDDDEGGLTYGLTEEPAEEEENKPKISYAPDTSIKDPRGPAQEAVVQPSNTIIILGVIGFVGWLTMLIMILIPVLFPLDFENAEALTIDTGFASALATGGFGGGGVQLPKEAADNPTGFDVSVWGQYPWYLFVPLLSPIFLGMLYSGLIILGAVKTQNLESRGWGLASCILLLISGLQLLTVAIFSVLPVTSELLGSVILVSVLVPTNSGGVTVLITLAAQVMEYLGILLAFAAAGAHFGMGIWGLTVLTREDVVAGFEFKPE